MPYNLQNKDARIAVIREIKGPENLKRKIESYKQQEIFRDRQHKYVLSYLNQQFSSQTVQEMPIISSINIARRITKKESSVYKSSPKREFSDLTDSQKEVVSKIYKDTGLDSKLQKSNEAYKLQNQNHLQIIVKDGIFLPRILWNHQIDVIPDDEDPEKAQAYIISAFDRTYDRITEYMGNLANKEASRLSFMTSDQLNQAIADPDDYRAKLERYVVWTSEFNFVMNGNGDILSQDMESPIPGVLPFIDISQEKECEYFVRQGQAVTDFSVQFNGALSDLGNVNKMQGWAQAYLIAEQDIIPQNIKIGPNYILKLPITAATQHKPEFGFANPDPDLQGSIQYNEMLLSTFLSSRGISPKMITTKGESEKYNSGFDRLLAMIDQFEATKEDFTTYETVEKKIYNLFKAWHNAYRGTDQLDPAYQTEELPESSQVSVKFNEPQLVQSEQEKLESVRVKRELGLMSRKEAIMELRNIDEKTAEEIMRQIDSEDLIESKSDNDQPDQESEMDEEKEDKEE